MTRATDIVLGVAAGIAAYKSVLLLRQLQERGYNVTVIPTEASLNFVGLATWEGLTSQPVMTSVFDEAGAHVDLGSQADLVVVAPATADLLARAASGRADDLLTSTMLMARCPILMAPAMHTAMWEHPATQANIATLGDRGVRFVGPESGPLAGMDSGMGRMSEPETILAMCEQLVEQA